MSEASEIIGKLGGPSEVARQIGVSRQAVSKWKRIPGGHVRRIAALSGGAYTKAQIRPDLYEPGE